VSRYADVDKAFKDPVGDVSNAVTFLASDEARFVTGITLPVDAGPRRNEAPAPARQSPVGSVTPSNGMTSAANSSS
jgi:hypothetical protein